MSNYFNYPEVCIGNKVYYTFNGFNKIFYFSDWYKMGFDKLTEEKLMEFATWVFEIRKSKFDVEEQFLIKTGEREI
jgi:hypothetical protein